MNLLKIRKRWITRWLTDNFKSRDASASKNYSDRKTEEEILTLRQVLTAKERHAAGKIDNWPHTPKILHQNDKHTISVERFAKLKNFQVWSADWASPSGGSSARTWPRAWKTCRRAPPTREQRKIFNLQRFFYTISGKTPLSRPSNLKVWSIAQICRTLQERRVRGWSQAYRLPPPSRWFDLPLFVVNRVNTLTNTQMDFKWGKHLLIVLSL